MVILMIFYLDSVSHPKPVKVVYKASQEIKIKKKMKSTRYGLKRLATGRSSQSSLKVGKKKSELSKKSSQNFKKEKVVHIQQHELPVQTSEISPENLKEELIIKNNIEEYYK